MYSRISLNGFSALADRKPKAMRKNFCLADGNAHFIPEKILFLSLPALMTTMCRPEWQNFRDPYTDGMRAGMKNKKYR